MLEPSGNRPHDPEFQRFPKPDSSHVRTYHTVELHPPVADAGRSIDHVFSHPASHTATPYATRDHKGCIRDVRSEPRLVRLQYISPDNRASVIAGLPDVQAARHGLILASGHEVNDRGDLGDGRTREELDHRDQAASKSRAWRRSALTSSSVEKEGTSGTLRIS